MAEIYDKTSFIWPEGTPDDDSYIAYADTGTGLMKRTSPSALIGSAVSELNLENQRLALRFNDYHHVDHGMFWIPNYPYADFFVDMLVRPMQASVLGYVISPGYGAAHNCLIGFNASSTHAAVTGNIWNGVGATSFTSEQVIPLGDWVHVAVGWDRTRIIVWINGVKEGETAYTADTRSTPLPIDGTMFVGGSDHNNYQFDLSWIRIFEGRPPFPTLHYQPFIPERFPRAYYNSGNDITYRASFLADYSVPGGIIPDLSDGLHTGISQVVTNTVVAAAGITSNGNARSIVTAAGLTGSPVTVTIPVTTALNTAALVASTFRTAISSNAAINNLFRVGGSGADITLTLRDPQANDPTMNFTIEDVTSAGITEDVTAVQTTAGFAGARVRHPGVRASATDNGIGNPWGLNPIDDADLPQWVEATIERPETPTPSVPVGAVVYDSFGRTVNHFWDIDAEVTAGSTEGGSAGILAWQGTPGDYGTSYGRLYAHATNAGLIYVNSGTADQDISVAFDLNVTIYCRRTDSNNVVFITASEVSGNIRVASYIAGVGGDIYNSAATFAASPIRVIVEGDSIEVYSNGVLAFSDATAGMPMTGNQVGLQLTGNDEAKVHSITVLAP